MSIVSDLQEEAKDAFYTWEEMHGYTDLSDRDRQIWCAGYVFGGLVPHIEKLRAIIAEAEGENAEYFDAEGIMQSLVLEKMH